MGSSPVLRKPCTVRAAFVILTLVLLASVVLQAILCKSSGSVMWASSFSRASQLPHTQPSLSCSPVVSPAYGFFIWLILFASFLVHSRVPVLSKVNCCSFFHNSGEVFLNGISTCMLVLKDTLFVPRKRSPISLSHVISPPSLSSMSLRSRESLVGLPNSKTFPTPQGMESQPCPQPQLTRWVT